MNILYFPLRILPDENLKNAKLNYERALNEKNIGDKVFIESKEQFDRTSQFYENEVLPKIELKQAMLQIEQDKS
ncbi:hypothetical protein IZY60_11410 [Lutibacter sp. B2]|nr:hypothetical protein [Lutibacter sp. B2]